MPNTIGKSLIGYYVDYDPKKECEKKSYQVNHGRGMRSYLTVGYAFGDSMEFLMRETYDKLEQVRGVTVGGWMPAHQFEELSYGLNGDVLEVFDEVVERDYPNTVDKTHANYEELQCRIIIALSDHSWTGDKVYQFLSKQMKYMMWKM